MSSILQGLGNCSPGRLPASTFDCVAALPNVNLTLISEDPRKRTRLPSLGHHRPMHTDKADDLIANCGTYAVHMLITD